MKRTRTIETTQSTQLVKAARTSKAKKNTFKIPRYLAPTRVGFPKQLKVKHRYVEVVNLLSGPGLVKTYQFSCNGMYDPNIPGAGQQPMYFDQLSAIYNHYTVVSSKITVHFAPRDTNQCTVGVYIEDDTTITPGSANTMCEQSSARYQIVLGSVADVPHTIRNKWNAVQAFGPGTLANDDLQGSSGANPVEQQYYTLFVQDLQSTATVSFAAHVTLEYEAVWDELKNIGSS